MTRPPFSWRALEILILAAILSVVAATCAKAQALRVDVSTANCTQTMSGQVNAYTGPWALFGWQYGIVGVNVGSGAVVKQNGVGKPSTGCAVPLVYQGDCWQSVTSLTATNGTPKWVVTAGPPPMCGMGGLAVWKYDGAIFAWKGLIPAPGIDRNAVPVLDGDVAYVGGGGTKTEFDLAAMTVVGVVPSIPPGEGRQGDALGFGYRIFPDSRFPLVNGGQQHFIVLRADQPTPTMPAPAATATPGGVTRTPTAAPTPDPCSVVPGGCTPRPTRTIPIGRTATPTPTVPPARFSVTVTWSKPDGTHGFGTAVPLTSTTTAYWFFSSDNLELMGKLLDGCGINGNRWFFCAGLTNVAVTITVHDNLTGITRVYRNQQGVAFQPIQDTALEPCGAL